MSSGDYFVVHSHLCPSLHGLNRRKSTGSKTAMRFLPVRTRRRYSFHGTRFENRVIRFTLTLGATGGSASQARLRGEGAHSVAEPGPA